MIKYRRMKVLTSRQMKEIDRKNDRGGRHSRHRAHGKRRDPIVEALKRRFPAPERRARRHRRREGEQRRRRLVVARHLWNQGARPVVLLLASKDDVRGDAAVNLAAALNIGILSRRSRLLMSGVGIKRRFPGPR